MKPTYTEQCLERAAKATEGPWELCEHTYHPDSDKLDWEVCEIRGPNQYDTSFQIQDAEFIAHSRTDVVELATRLNRAIEGLREVHRFYARIYDANPNQVDVFEKYQSPHQRLADELEAIPGDEK